MSCCGKQRSQFHAPNMMYRVHEPTAGTATQPQITKQFVVCFEYVGKTGLTVWGPVSGRRYRFDRQGSRVVIDPRDRPSLLLVPNLRQVSNFTEVNR